MSTHTTTTRTESSSELRKSSSVTESFIHFSQDNYKNIYIRSASPMIHVNQICLGGQWTYETTLNLLKLIGRFLKTVKIWIIL